MTTREVSEYLGGYDGYVFYFSDVVMYGIPKPIEAFGMKVPPTNWCHVKERTEQ